MEADAITAEIQQAETALAAKQTEIETARKLLVQELASVEAALTRAIDLRASLLDELEPRLLVLFEQVARMRKGVAICSATHNGLCSLCHVRLRPHVFQLVRQNDSIIQCDTCQRILYYVPPSPVEPATTHTS